MPYTKNRYNPEEDQDRAHGALNQKLSDSIRQCAKETVMLGDELKEKLQAISDRHQVLNELEALQDDFNVPLKQLEKRLQLLQQIKAFGLFDHLAKASTHELEQRIQAIETINALEPDPDNRPTLKSLRERAKLLQEVAHHSRLQQIKAMAEAEREEEEAAA
jgi:hypothetical protein